MGSPFHDFTARLCAFEKLIDVAPLGKAKQSSLSRWSRSDDAQRAVQRLGNIDYAFHTDKELMPWWELRFGAPVPARYIVLNNRRNEKYRSIANRINVKIQAEDQSWHEVLRGDLAFGAEPDSLPLLIPLSNSPRIAAIRVGIDGTNYFHLSSVNVLAPANWGSNQRKSPAFLAARSDGLGERLRAVLNAIVAAEKFGCDFRVHWRSRTPEATQFHAVLPAEETFSPDFVERHVLSDTELASMTTAPARDHRIAPKALGTAAMFDGLALDQHGLTAQIPTLKGLVKTADFARAFERIAFHPHLEKARSAAHKLELRGKPIAIHIRAGDIVYGKHRHTDRFTVKVTPFPLVEGLIRKAKEAGNEILLFGQDRALCDYLAEKYGALLADSYGDDQNFDEAQRALFEICLMTRCSEIFAGNSGFAIVAGLMGGSKPKPADTVLSRGEMAAELLRSILNATDPRISSMQLAYSCLYTVALFRNELAPEAVDRLTEIATQRDPTNPFLFLQRASHLYSISAIPQAEAMLRSEIEKDGEFGMWWLFTERHPGGKVAATDYLAPLQAAADAGWPVAALCLAAERQSNRDSTAVARYLNIYLSGRTAPLPEWEARLANPISVAE